MQEPVLSETVIRCAFEVSNALGAGFLEKVYENALCISMKDAGLKVTQQQQFDVSFRQHRRQLLRRHSG